jgi:hypothetical protein
MRTHILTSKYRRITQVRHTGAAILRYQTDGGLNVHQMLNIFLRIRYVGQTVVGYTNRAIKLIESQ